MDTKSKIVKLPLLKRKIAQLRGQGYTIAFTNGCFDILHYGHVRYLEQAKEGSRRILVVGLNSDRSIRKIKGPSRPIVKETGRAAVLAGLASVDYITLFDEDTPVKFGERMCLLIPNSRFQVLEGAGHFSFLDKPEEFVKILSGFVK